MPEQDLEGLRKHIAERVSRWFGEPVLAVEDEVMRLVQAEVAAVELEAMRTRYALALMYWQYCNRPYGHDYMGAGEAAIDILEDYGLASEEIGVDKQAIQAIRDLENAMAQLSRPPQQTHGKEDKPNGEE